MVPVQQQPRAHELLCTKPCRIPSTNAPPIIQCCSLIPSCGFYRVLSALPNPPCLLSVHAVTCCCLQFPTSILLSTSPCPFPYCSFLYRVFSTYWQVTPFPLPCQQFPVDFCRVHISDRKIAACTTNGGFALLCVPYGAQPLPDPLDPLLTNSHLNIHLGLTAGAAGTVCGAETLRLCICLQALPILEVALQEGHVCALCLSSSFLLPVS